MPLIPLKKNNVTERNPRMSEFLSFAIGTTLGGMVGVACMCLLQINRLSSREEEVDEEKKRAGAFPTDRGRS